MRQLRSIRLWSLLQFFYDLCAVDVGDLAYPVRQEIRRSLFTGHLNTRAFISPLDEVLEGSVDGWQEPERLLDTARMILRRYRRMGRKKSGWLSGYLQAQLWHLADCGRCQCFVAETIRTEAAAEASVMTLMRSSGAAKATDFLDRP